MFDTARVKQDFSRAAESYDAYASLQQSVLQTLYRKIQPMIAPNASVLDVGCGTGQLGGMINNHELTQLDIAIGMCKKACANGLGTLCATMQSLPFKKETFDVVFSSLALQWSPDWQHAVKEMQRVLKPCGVLAISSLAEGTLKELKESFTVLDDDTHISEFPHKSAFDYHETRCEYFPNLHSIMHQLRAIGATHKQSRKRKSLITPAQMKRVEQYYAKHFGSQKGLPLTWEIVYSVQKKS